HVGFRIHVHLAHTQLALILFGKLVNQWRNHLARPAPLGPEVNQDRYFRLEYLGLEVVIGDVKSILTHCIDLLLLALAASLGAACVDAALQKWYDFARLALSAVEC